MAEKQIDWVDVILKDVVRAATWGIILLVILTLFLNVVKQDIKEAIDFGAKRIVYEAVRFGTDPFLIGKGKQLVKEGIEYSVDTAGRRYKKILNQTEGGPPVGATGQGEKTGGR